MAEDAATLVVRLEATQARFERDMRRAEGAFSRAAGGIERRANGLDSRLARVGDPLVHGFDRLAKSAAASASVFEKEMDRAAGKFRSLENALNPATAALRRYEQAQETVANAVRMGVVTQQQADAVLMQARAQYEGLTTVVGNSGRTWNRSGAMIQQVGFQVGDFATQVASGQGVLRPFIQQGTQMVSAFGPWGAVLGAAGAVVGALAVSLFNAGEKAASFEDKIRDLQSAIDDFDGFQKHVSDLDEVIAKYGEWDEAVGRLISELRRQKFDAVTDNLRAVVRDIESAIDEIVDQTPLDRLIEARGDENLPGFFAQLRDLRKEFEALGKSDSFATQADAADRMRSIVQQMLDGPLRDLIERTAPELVNQLTDAQDQAQQAAKAAGEIPHPLDNAANEAARLDDNLDGATRRAGALASELRRAAGALAGMSTSAFDRLARAQISLKFRGDPVGEARALAEREAQQVLGEAQAAVSADIPALMRPQVLDDLKENARRTVEAVTEAARIEQEIAQLAQAGGGGGRSGGGGGSAREPTVDVIHREIEAIREKVAALNQERELLLARAAAQNAGMAPEEIARQQEVLTASFERQRIVEELLNKAREEGLELTPQMRAEAEAMAAAVEQQTIANYDLEASIKAQADATKEAAQQQQELARGLAQTADRFVNAIQQADSFADALKRIGFELLNLAAQGLGGQGPLGSVLGNIIPSLFGGGGMSFGTSPIAGLPAIPTFTTPFAVAKGSAFRGGKVTPFAKGGVVAGPTVFPMSDGMGLMGEAGPEAVMPLKRGPGGRLGVQAHGGSTSRLVVELSPDLTARVLDQARADSVQISQQATRRGIAGLKSANMDRRQFP